MYPTLESIPKELIEEFRASRKMKNSSIAFCESDAKLEKIAMAFLNSFNQFANNVTSFLEHQREVNEIVIQNALKKLKGNYFNLFLEDASNDEIDPQDNSDVHSFAMTVNQSSECIVSPSLSSKVTDLNVEISKKRGRPKKK